MGFYLSRCCLYLTITETCTWNLENSFVVQENSKATIVMEYHHIKFGSGMSRFSNKSG